MFSAHGRLRVSPVQLDFDIGLERRFRIGSTRRVGALWDTRFTLPNPAIEERWVVYFVMEGELRWHEPELVFTSPSSFVATSGELAGSDGRRLRSFRSTAEFTGVELHVAPRELRAVPSTPFALTSSAPTFEAARAYTELVHSERSLGPTDRDAAVAKLLQALYADGVLHHDLSTTMHPVEGAEAVLWQAFVPFVERLVLGPSLDEMSTRTKMSLRQLGRAVDRFLKGFSLPWSGWRELTRGYRLHVAALLLSNPELAIAEIAERTGYSSAEALSHALTAEGLLPPMELRRRLIDG